MSSNNFPSTISNEDNYQFNGFPPFYTQSTTSTSDQQPSSSYTPGGTIGIGLNGPGTHLEETTPNVPATVVKSSGRGRRKQRKKIPCPEALMQQALKIEQMEDPELKNLNEAVPSMGMPDLLYQTNIIGEEEPLNDNQLLLNSNTLDHILSHKKMLLLQSPDVIEFLKKQQPTDNRN